MKPKKISEEEFEYIYSKVPRVCVEVLVKTDQGIILTLRKIKPCKGMWHIPGGTVLKSETLEEAVKRVAKAELGVEIEIEKMVGAIEYPKLADKQHAVGIAFLTKITSGDLCVDYQASKFEAFKTLPPKMVKEQKKFLTDYLRMI